MSEKNKLAKAGTASAATVAKTSPSAAAKASPKPAKPDLTVKIVKGDTGGNKAIVTRKPRNETLDHRSKGKAKTVLPVGERAGLVAREAYFMAERRGFRIGNDLADWLEAERIVDERHEFI
jgi:Protein of unknown function (DUF2934)